MAWNHSVADIDFITGVWADADNIEPEVLDSLLDSAHAACVAYAPVLPIGAAVPANYRLAEIFQARHIWSSFQGANDSVMGPDGYEVATNTFNLVLVSRDLLRPKTSPLSRIR